MNSVQVFVPETLGTGYAEIVRNEAGEVVALWPLATNSVTPKRDENGTLFYEVGDEVLFPDDLLVIPGLSPDGTTGYRLLEIARTTLEFAENAQTFGSTFMANAARPSGILTHPGELSDEAKASLRTSWRSLYSGPESAGKVALLDEGMGFESLTFTNESTQYYELLSHFTLEVARLLNIQPNKLMSIEKASYSSLESMNNDFVVTTLRPWLVKIEAEINKKVLRDPNLYCEFLVDSLLRADTEKRYAAYSVGLMNGFLSVNEVRKKEGLAAIPGGDQYFKPLNQAAVNGASNGTTLSTTSNNQPSGGSEPSEGEPTGGTGGEV